jgi:hypothetical protein
MTTTNLVRGDKRTIPESVKVHFSQYIKISEEKYRNLYNKLVISQ